MIHEPSFASQKVKWKMEENIVALSVADVAKVSAAVLEEGTHEKTVKKKLWQVVNIICVFCPQIGTVLSIN